MQAALGKRAYGDRKLAGLFSSFQVNVPQIDAHVDRERAKTYGVPLTDVFETLQVYLGSLYVNDFNRFGRTYQVNVQAESALPPAAGTDRAAEDPERRRRDGAARSLVRRRGYGPDQVMHYNGYPAAEINGGRRPGSARARRRTRLPRSSTPDCRAGWHYEWTELAYQEKLAGNTMLLIFPLCVLLVYLVLAAQYESWTLPLSVILIVPMTSARRIAGVWLTGGDNNVFTQIGFLVLAAGLQERDPDRRVRRAARSRGRGPRAARSSTPAACGCGRC